MKNRTVDRFIYSNETKTHKNGQPYTETIKVLDGQGTFLEFGVDYQELEYGVGTYSVALVLVNNEVKSIPVDLIKFKEVTQNEPNE